MNGRLPAVIVCLLGFAWSPPTLAWGDIGHRIICEIAFQELNDGARERVKALIRQDFEFDTFAQSCSWPDHPRRRAVEHYVNLPRDAEGLADPCPLADECVISAIEKDPAVLSSSSATEQERLVGLKYLGHWVGDVHQPLHVSFQDDRGGNDIGISGGLCSWDLHAVWDGCIIEQGAPRGCVRDRLGTCATRSPTRTGGRGGHQLRSTGRTSRSRSLSARRSGTACLPMRGAGTPRATSAWTMASR